MKGFQRSADEREAAVSSREEEFVYCDYSMYGVFVELYSV